MKEWLKEFWEEFGINLGGKLGELLGGLIGSSIGMFLYWLGQQGVYSYLRNLKEQLKTQDFVIAEGAPFWTQLFTHPWVVPIMFFIGAVIGGTIGVLIVKKLK